MELSDKLKITSQVTLKSGEKFGLSGWTRWTWVHVSHEFLKAEGGDRRGRQSDAAEVWRGEAGEEVKCEKSLTNVAGFEDGGREAPDKEYGWVREAENNFQRKNGNLGPVIARNTLHDLPTTWMTLEAVSSLELPDESLSWWHFDYSLW